MTQKEIIRSAAFKALGQLTETPPNVEGAKNQLAKILNLTTLQPRPTRPKDNFRGTQ